MPFQKFNYLSCLGNSKREHKTTLTFQQLHLGCTDVRLMVAIKGAQSASNREDP